MSSTAGLKKLVKEAIADTGIAMQGGLDPRGYPSDRVADAAIQAMRDALLSEAAVEAAASALLAETQRRIGFDPKECKALDELVSVVRQDYLIDARAALTAALAAMGAVTEG